MEHLHEEAVRYLCGSDKSVVMMGAIAVPALAMAMMALLLDLI